MPEADEPPLVDSEGSFAPDADLSEGIGMPAAVSMRSTLDVSQLPSDILPRLKSVVQEARQDMGAEVFDARGSRLTVLSGITDMLGICQLILDGNRLTSLPEDIHRLEKLATLSVADNRLTTLPTSIGRLQALRHLRITGNMLESVPEELGQCVNLDTLSLEGNRFTAFPSCLIALPALTQFSLDWFRYAQPSLPIMLTSTGSWWTALRELAQSAIEKGQAVVTFQQMMDALSQRPWEKDQVVVDSRIWAPIHRASSEGHEGVVRALLAMGCETGMQDCDGFGPVMLAVREQHTNVVVLLLEAKVDPMEGGGSLGSPLHMAAVNFDVQAAESLVAHKATAYSADRDGNTPLHCVMSVFDRDAERGSQMVDLLIDNGADCNALNKDCWAAMHLAARRGQIGAVAYSRENLSCAPYECLENQCTHGPLGRPSMQHTRRIARKCRRLFDFDAAGGAHYWTPLHLAAHASHCQCVQLLLEAAADVFRRTMDGSTPRQVCRGHVATTKLIRIFEREWLWRKVAPTAVGDPDSSSSGITRRPSTPGNWAAGFLSFGTKRSGGRPQQSKDNLSPRDTSMSAEARRSELGNWGKSDETLREDSCRALQSACRRPKVSPRWKDRVQSVVAQPASGRSWLQLLGAAVETQERRRDIAPLLTQAEAMSWMRDPSLRDDRGRTPMMLLCERADEDALSIVLRQVSPEEVLAMLGASDDTHQATPLHLLCDRPSRSQRSVLEEDRARSDVFLSLEQVLPEMLPVNAKDVRGLTPLHRACRGGLSVVARLLLAAGAAVNATEETCLYTPLHCAVAGSHHGIILLLARQPRVKIDARDSLDWTPLMEAASRLDARAIGLLANHKAEFNSSDDLLQVVQQAKTDQAAKRWMCTLLCSTGVDPTGSVAELQSDLLSELQAAYKRSQTSRKPDAPLWTVPLALAPRCSSCKVVLGGGGLECHFCGTIQCDLCLVEVVLPATWTRSSGKLPPVCANGWDSDDDVVADERLGVDCDTQDIGDDRPCNACSDCNAFFFKCVFRGI
mmetsp:Transcript_44419/g.100220  ORF Transcript_44419/g.100220 Transcript_44419/m.100220 type:complete len:1024 (-) Transcript_44419:196-3267(-)